MYPKFAHCVSNPPYQESTVASTDNNNATNIFQHFYALGLHTSTQTTMIFPGGRWMQRQSKSGAIADLIINTITQVEWYPNGKEKNKDEFIFPTVVINDGVSIVYANSGSYPTNIIVNKVQLPRPQADGIIPLGTENLQLIAATTQSPKISSRRYSRNCFGLPSYYVERSPENIKPVDDTTSNKALHPPTDDGPWIKAYLADEKPGSAKRVKQFWLKQDAVEWNSMRQQLYKQWKVYIIQASASKCPELGPYLIAPANCVTGESWLIVGSFDTFEEAQNYKAYLDTSVVRSLLAASKGGNIKTWGYFVPDLGSYIAPPPDNITTMFT